MALSFQKASKKSAKLRMALIGVAGAGKTYTALNIAQHLGGPVAVIDTEHGSASKYSDVFEFDVLELESFSPQTYIEAIRAADEAGYNVLIIDSLSHAWTGKDGALELVDRAAKRQQTINTFGAWRDVTPLHNAMVDAIISSRLHIIATMRAKTEYVQEKNEKTGKTVVRKVGLAPVQRDGLEYEFDVVADLDQDNNLIVGKTRCPVIAGLVFPKAGKEVAGKLNAWLTDGTPSAPPEARFARAAERPAPRAAEQKSERKSERSGERSTTAATPLSDIKPAGRGTDNSATKASVTNNSGADSFGEDEIVLCHCGIDARYIRGKSGSGWVCGHHGTRTAMCDFRMRDADPEADSDEEPDPFEHDAGGRGELAAVGAGFSDDAAPAFAMRQTVSMNGAAAH